MRQTPVRSTKLERSCGRVNFVTPLSTTTNPPTFIRDPYPYFAQKREGAGVFHGTVVDYVQ